MQPSANADVRITVPYLDRYLKFVFVFVHLYKYKYKYMVLYLDRYLYSSLYSDTVKSKCPKCKSTLFPLISRPFYVGLLPKSRSESKSSRCAETETEAYQFYGTTAINHDAFQSQL